MSRWGIFLVGAAVQILVALSRFAPGIADWWVKQHESGALLQPLSTLFSIHFALLVLTLAASAMKDAGDREKWQSQILSATKDGSVALLSDSAFYSDFLKRASDAKFSVKIAYLSPVPPTQVNRKERLAYYARILQLMREKQNVQFHRIVRNSPANRIWIVEMSKALATYPNVKITLLSDIDQEKADPLSLSIQIIDRSQAYLVALGGHEKDGEFRDMVISNEGATVLLERYYERLSRLGVLVFDNGRLTPDGDRLLQRENELLAKKDKK